MMCFFSGYFYIALAVLFVVVISAVLRRITGRQQNSQSSHPNSVQTRGANDEVPVVTTVPSAPSYELESRNENIDSPPCYEDAIKLGPPDKINKNYSRQS